MAGDNVALLLSNENTTMFCKKLKLAKFNKKSVIKTEYQIQQQV